MAKAVTYAAFGGPEVLEVTEVDEPAPQAHQIRVRVTAAGLNPVDWKAVGSADMAGWLGIELPAGFGSDFAGVVDEVGAEAQGFAVGDRVYGRARNRSVAEYLLADLENDVVVHTPEGLDDVTASTLVIAGRTADATLRAVRLNAGETVLIGAAAGGVGVFASQLARAAGARVIGTGSATTADFLEGLGVVPVTYGDGLADRVAQLAPEGIAAAIDLHGTEAAEAAIALGVPPERIATVAAMAPPEGVHAANESEADPGALDHLTGLIASGDLVVPIAATFPLEEVREAVALQQDGHVHGKVVVTVGPPAATPA